MWNENWQRFNLKSIARIFICWLLAFLSVGFVSCLLSFVVVLSSFSNVSVFCSCIFVVENWVGFVV